MADFVEFNGADGPSAMDTPAASKAVKSAWESQAAKYGGIFPQVTNVNDNEPGRDYLPRNTTKSNGKQG